LHFCILAIPANAAYCSPGVERNQPRFIGFLDNDFNRSGHPGTDSCISICELNPDLEIHDPLVQGTYRTDFNDLPAVLPIQNGIKCQDDWLIDFHKIDIDL
jgi:hypothetical protein